MKKSTQKKKIIVFLKQVPDHTGSYALCAVGVLPVLSYLMLSIGLDNLLCSLLASYRFLFSLYFFRWSHVLCSFGGPRKCSFLGRGLVSKVVIQGSCGSSRLLVFL